MERLDSSLLHIGKNRQLFFDNMIIERVQDITITVHVQRAEPKPIMMADKPWEKITYFAIGTYQILRDKDNNWHCWYGIWDYDAKRFAKKRDWYDIRVNWLRLCYAKSTDGIHWEKPNLGIYKDHGSDTNIIMGDEKSGSFYIVNPIEDIYETDSSKCFKTLCVHQNSEVYRIEAYHSADAVHWNPYNRLPSFGTWGPNLADEVILTYDSLGKIYIATVRSPYLLSAPLNPNSPNTDSFIGPSEPGAWWLYNKRRIWQTESSDFLNWTQPYPIFQPDELDNLDESYYAMCQTKIGDTYIAFVNILRECANTISVRMAYSRDGKNWEWANQRQPWLKSENMSGKEWDSVMVYLGVPPIEVGGEHWIYYGGAKNHHDWWLTGIVEGIDNPECYNRSKVGYHLGLAKIRLDGFVSLDTSPHREGLIVTRPFFPEGNRIKP